MTPDQQPLSPTDSTVSAALDRISVATVKLDADAVADCFADDAHVRTHHGTFVGKDLIRAYLRWAIGQARSIRIDERGIGRAIHAPHAFVEGVESITTHDGNTYAFPYLICATFDSQGAVTDWSRLSDRWLLAHQGARQTSGPSGALLRWFVRQVDTAFSKDMPTPTQNPS